ncbi:hypothetical protein ACFQH8_20140 [Halomicroarcula sp. GCM10025710]
MNTVVAGALQPAIQQDAQIGLTLPLCSVTAGVLAITALVVNVVIYIAAARAFTRQGPDSGRFTGSLFTRRIGRASLTAVGSNIVVSIATIIGFVLLVIPGISLAVISPSSYSPSESKTGGSSNRCLAVGLSHVGTAGGGGNSPLVVAVTGLGGSLGSIASFVSPTMGQLVTPLVTAPLAILGYGIIADASLQVRDEQSTGLGVKRSAWLHTVSRA